VAAAREDKKSNIVVRENFRVPGKKTWLCNAPILALFFDQIDDVIKYERACMAEVCEHLYDIGLVADSGRAKPAPNERNRNVALADPPD
jgi:hypothetical protein